MRKRILSLLLTLSMAFTIIMTTGIASFAISDDTQILGTVKAYKGENAGDTVDIDFDAEEQYVSEGYSTLPRVNLYDSNFQVVKWNEFEDLVPQGEVMPCKASFTTKDLKTGTYYAEITFLPANSDGTVVETEKYPESKYVSGGAFKIVLKKFAAPKSVKAKAAKGKVTVSFKKAEGANGYGIYRSTKKSGNFKLIGTSNKTKYVDKKVRKGKKYYYLVVSARQTEDSKGKAYAIRSGYSKVAASGKVK